MTADKVLIADDKEESRYLLRTLLQSKGYEVEEAVHGAEALIKARQNPPILVISDLLMPVMDGYTLLRHWKADETLQAVPFVVYTATYTDEKDERLARDMGADDFILKPTEPEPFIERIQHVLRKAQKGEFSTRSPTALAEGISQTYNDILIRKMEEKALQLEEANRRLQQDIDDRRRMEEALTQSEDQLRSVVQTAGDAIVTTNAQGKIQMWNDAAEALFGYRAEEIIGKPLTTILPERFHDTFARRKKKMAQTGQLIIGRHPAEAAGLRRDGTEFPVEITISYWKIKQGSFSTAVIRDITRRKQADEAIRSSQAMLQTVLDSIPSAVFWKDRNLNYLGANRTFLKAVGWKTAEDIVGKSDYDLPWEKAQADSFRKYDLKIIESGSPENDIIESFRQADGTLAWAQTNKVPMRDASGNVIGVLGTYEDITQRRQAEEALRKSETQLSNAAAMARLGPWEFDVERNKFTFTDSFYAVFKTTADDIGGYTMSPAEYAKRFVHPDDQTIVSEETRKALETTDPQYSRTLEHRIFFADGTLGYISVRFCIEKNAAGKTVRTYGVNQDITERKRAEEALRKRLQELEGMNRLSIILRSASSLDDMLPSLLEETLSAAESDAGAIWLFDAAAGSIQRRAARGWLDGLPATNIKPGEGFPGGAFSADYAVLSDAFAADPRFRPARGSGLPKDWGGACIPIRSNREAIGILCVSVQHPRKLTADETRLLTTFAEMAGTAIQRIRLYEQTKNQLDRMSTMHAIDSAITASMNLNVTMSYLLDQVVGRLHVDAAAVLLANPQMMMLEYFAGRGFRGKGISSTRLRFGEGHAGRAAIERKLIHITDIARVPPAHPERLTGEGFVSHTAIPLIAKGQVKGILELFRRDLFTPDADWLDFLNTFAGQAAIAIDNAMLFSDLQRANTQLARAYDATLEGWSHAMDLRDKETEGHSERVTETTLLLAQEMGITGEELLHIRRGALLHDLGKLGIPDYILYKPESLSKEEMEIMQRHPTLAYEMLMPIEFLRPALDIPYCHHERWDGSGYPRGLKGEQIPIAARLFAVADVFDALTSDRPYRAAWSREKARKYIRERSGKDFDPRAVEAFLHLER